MSAFRGNPEDICSHGVLLGLTDLRCVRGHKSWCSRKFASNTLSVRAVLRHSVETRRDVHGQHAEQKASEDLQNRMAVCAAAAEIPDREEQYPRDKETNHVRAVLWRSGSSRGQDRGP